MPCSEGAFRQTDGLTLVVERVQKIYNDDAMRRFAQKRCELEAVDSVGQGVACRVCGVW